MEKKKIIKFVPYILISVLVGVTAAYATEFPPTPASVGKSMYTLKDIYNLSDGTVIEARSGQLETVPPLSSSLKSLKSAYEKISAERSKLSNSKIANGVGAFGFTGSLFGDTDATKVLASATYGGTMMDNGAVTITPSAASQPIPAGYHNGSGTVATDVNLITDNIKNGISIFGVSGKTSIVDTISATASAGDILSGKIAYTNGVELIGTYTAATDVNLVSSNIKNGVTIFGVTGSLTSSATGIPKTGQTTSYTANDDGAYQKGFGGSRFLDNGNSTITDNATGLMWMKCSVGQSGTGCATGGYSTPSWTDAIKACEDDTTGSYTDWRLPNIFELYSLLNFESGSSSWIDNSNFPLTKTTAQYRTSTTYKDSTTSAMGVSFATSGVSAVAKSTTGTFPFRCVR